MDIPLQYSLPEHEAIRRLLEDVVTCAAAAELDAYPEHNPLSRAAAAVERALREHARHEARAGRALDRIHQDEGSVAVELKHALGLEDVLEQVARIARLLAEEEQVISRLN